MGRDLTSLRCTFNGKPLLVLTSHFESEKQNSDERKAQFSQVGEPTKPFRGVACVVGATMRAVDHHNGRAVVTTVIACVEREGERKMIDTAQRVVAPTSATKPLYRLLKRVIGPDHKKNTILYGSPEAERISLRASVEQGLSSGIRLRRCDCAV